MPPACAGCRVAAHEGLPGARDHPSAAAGAPALRAQARRSARGCGPGELPWGQKDIGTSGVCGGEQSRRGGCGGGACSGRVRGPVRGASGGSLSLIRPHGRPGTWHPGQPLACLQADGTRWVGDAASWERRSPRGPGRLATGRLTCLAEVGFDTVHRLKCLFLCFPFTKGFSLGYFILFFGWVGTNPFLKML